MEKISERKLADEIKNKCKKIGLTKKQLSEQTKIDRTIINRIESMEYRPSIADLEKLSEVLDID